MRGVTGSSVVVVAAAFLFYAVLSRRLDDTPVTAAMIFVAVGLVFSDRGVDWLHLNVDQEGVQLLAEATLAVVLFTDASRIDLHTLRDASTAFPRVCWPSGSRSRSSPDRSWARSFCTRLHGQRRWL